MLYVYFKALASFLVDVVLLTDVVVFETIVADLKESTTVFE